MDEPEDTPATKKRKLTKAAQEKAKEKAKKKGKKGDGGDDGEEDPYTALSQSAWSGAPVKPPVGNLEKCAKCEKEFAVVRDCHLKLTFMLTQIIIIFIQTKYTMAANPGPGFLCHKCAKESGADPFKKSVSPGKRKAPAEKRTVVNFEENRFPTLASLCINVGNFVF